MQTITAGLFKLGLRDVAQGLIMASGGAAFGIISESVSKGVFTLDFTAIWHSALAAAVVYLGKRFFTPAQVIKPATDAQIASK
jgi:hypothetical protein